MNARLDAILIRYYRILQAVVTGLMGVMIVPVTLQIVSRYTGLIPRYIWTEEAARFCFIWLIMVGSMLAVRDGTHFVVDVLPKPTTPRWQAIGQLTETFFMVIMALVFVAYGYEYALFGYAQTSELTGINMVAIHIVYLLAGLTWMAFLGERILSAVVLLGGGHRDGR